jgi:hypothetical protein
MNTQQIIADLEQRRTAIRAAAAGRWATEQERATIRRLTAELGEAWDLRRQELARGPEHDHEIIVIHALKERTA